jgi:hypothetical protein
MRRFQLVDALAWEKSICVPIFESDDESLALAYLPKLSTAMDQPLEVIDAWRRENHFPASASPLLRTEQEAIHWLRKHHANEQPPTSR